MATPYNTSDSTEVHAEVDFMTMFTTQNDDGSSQQDKAETPLTHHSNTLPSASVPAYDPLQVFESSIHATSAAPGAWAMPQQQQQHSSLGLHAAGGGMHSPMSMGGMAPVAYAPQVAYHYPYNPHLQHHHAMALGQPFAQATPAQFVAPSVALPNNTRPDTATTQTSAASAPQTPVTAAPIDRPASAVSDGARPNAKLSPSTSISSSTVSTPPAVPAVATLDAAAVRTTRRKRKLTPEDKRRICEIYRNSQGKIRQEDIAKEYSVDRSTISKILNQEDRWLDPEAPGANSMLSRRPGGRYPAIEEEMHRWLDEAVAQGRDIRDSEAREEALQIGHRLGHPHFQASSKWWDGVKRRRVEEGRPLPSSRRAAPSMMAPIAMPNLAHSYSAMSLGSPVHPFPMAGPSAYTIMDPHAAAAAAAAAYAGMVPVTPASRARSLSAPQQMQMGMMTPQQPQQQPSFGPAPRQRMSPPRHSPVTPLTRNRSYHGSSGASPRPSPLNRANSAGGRPSPHQRLGASAFGLTPMNADAPVTSPSQKEFDTTSTVSVPSLSPSSACPSETSDVQHTTTLSPSTPCTPAQANFQVPTVPQPEGLDCQPQPVLYQQPMAMYHPGYPMQPGQYYPAYEYVQQY